MKHSLLDLFLDAWNFCHGHASLFQGDGSSGDYLSAEKLELQCYKMLQAERAQKWGSIARDH
jgi:hypothetical protein